MLSSSAALQVAWFEQFVKQGLTIHLAKSLPRHCFILQILFNGRFDNIYKANI